MIELYKGFFVSVQHIVSVEKIFRRTGYVVKVTMSNGKRYTLRDADTPETLACILGRFQIEFLCS